MIVSGVGRKWECSDSSDSDSVELTTPIFDFHKVISALTTPTTTSLVKTSLKGLFGDVIVNIFFH